MGYDLSQFVDTIKPYHICSICGDVLNDAISTHCCDGLFCYLCIQRWQNSSNNCPLCKRKISSVSIQNRDKRTNKNILSERVTCSLKEEDDCSWIGHLSDLSTHISANHHNCPFEKFGCTAKGMSRQALDRHISDNELSHLRSEVIFLRNKVARLEQRASLSSVFNSRQSSNT
jgi:hypothetical protein